MYLNIYKIEEDIVIAVCDKDIIGKKFREGELVLKIEESFYKGYEATKDEVIEALSYATIANISGEKAIACALECGCIDKENIIFIDGIPHAQMIRL